MLTQIPPTLLIDPRYRSHSKRHSSRIIRRSPREAATIALKARTDTRHTPELARSLFWRSYRQTIWRTMPLRRHGGAPSRTGTAYRLSSNPREVASHEQRALLFAILNNQRSPGKMPEGRKFSK